MRAKPQNIIFITLVGLLFISSCDQKSSSNIQKKQPQKESTITGRYTFEDQSASITIFIGEKSWQGKIKVKTGVSSQYDNRKAKYPDGILKGNALYDNSGTTKVGEVQNKQLSYSAFGQTITLHKE